MRYGKTVIALYASALAAAGFAGWTSSNLPTPATTFRAIDGDSLEDNAGARYRLFGIDAPELKQTCTRENRVYPCGEIAKSTLQSLLELGAPVICNGPTRDKYGRYLVTCFGRLGVDLNAQMVLSGNAVAYTRYSNRYVTEERVAKSARRGIWSSVFTLPEEYRHQEGPR